MPTNLTKEYAALQKELGIGNPHAVPRIERVIVNVGVGKQRDDKSFIEAVKRDLALLTGQQPHERLARKAVAGFKVREHNLVGLRVTLRGQRRDDFVRRFIDVTLPRVRDFRGIPVTSLDGHGNISVGLPEHLAFPEIHPEKTDIIFGVEVTFVTTASDDKVAIAMLRALGFPLSDTEIEDIELDTARSKADKLSTEKKAKKQTN